MNLYLKRLRGWRSNTKVIFICGNKMPTRCNRGFLLQILLLAQHVSGITMPETCWASNKICNKKTSVASIWHFISTY